MDALARSGDQPIVFQDSTSVLIQRISGLVLVAATCVWFAMGLWLSATIAAVGAAFEFASSGGRVTVDGAELVLHARRQNRRVRTAEIASVDPNFKGYFMRTPRLVLHSGQVIALTPFRCPTLLRTRSRATEHLAEYLGLPASDPGPPAFRMSWFALAAVISVGFLFGVPLVVAGAAEIVGGGILSGAVVVAVGGVLCACAVCAVRAQRARRAAEANEPGEAQRRV